MKHHCKECGGSGLCPHRQQKRCCKECGRVGLCPGPTGTLVAAVDFHGAEYNGNTDEAEGRACGGGKGRGEGADSGNGGDEGTCTMSGSSSELMRGAVCQGSVMTSTTTEDAA